MSIDLAWRSLSSNERAYIIEGIRSVYLYPHERDCVTCYGGVPCGAIMHIVDLIAAMERYQ